MDAIALLKQDHVKVKGLLADLEKTTERGVKTREELFATIKGELLVHETIEEEIFYPELKRHPKAKDVVLEGFQEHHVVDLLMGELEALPVDDETWGAKALVMKENIEHHVVDLLMGELERLPVDDETWGAKALVMKENIEHHIEEEEGEMFKTARRVFDQDELDELGERMLARKQAAMTELGMPVAARR